MIAMSNVATKIDLERGNKLDIEDEATLRIQNLTTDEQEKFKRVQVEYDVAQSLSFKVPREMTNSMWVKVLKGDTQSRRKRLFSYLCQIESERNKRIEKKQKRQEHLELQRQIRAEAGEPDEIISRLHIKIHRSYMSRYWNNGLVRALMFGQPIVFDMGFTEYMTEKENIGAVEQIAMAYGQNKMNYEPFNIHFCNCAPDSKSSLWLNDKLKNEFVQQPLCEITSKSYLDIFPKEKLVYLSPNAPHVLKEFDSDAVYIIGGLVDLSESKPLTMAKAKEERIQMAKLPLDNYLQFRKGHKSLTLDQMMKIMLELRDTRDWMKAFRHVPQRKLDRQTNETIEMLRDRHVPSKRPQKERGATSGKPQKERGSTIEMLLNQLD
ncbi:unnamed protein product [Owenia fusiformis]|uniref:RNA (guanine-9-)-methyltransferase domain-containing protein 1 n=1 Tax=Owenia fusiformis TaxID=6347 RepID=A0A8S4P3W2_OWEFU|nr:unnamed protein product [Owenia fusiformis]